MQENYEYVQKGFRILLPVFADFVGKAMHHAFGDGWWEEVRRTLNDQQDLPLDGSYAELIDSLDVANCIRLLDRKWATLFAYAGLDRNCRTWAKELMGVRNAVSHIGQQDMDQGDAERALDTMTRLCEKMDESSAAKLRELYLQVRARDVGEASGIYGGLPQPETSSKRGVLLENSLLQLVGTDCVQKTDYTRKITLDGKTVAYPVYRIRLDFLYYNDQNDRIATWITRYESEHSDDTLQKMDRDAFNQIIEGFIVESNPEALQRTQQNIALVGQREAGVTLTDGRVVDGNRRLTCLRRIQQKTAQPQYFETVLLDVDIHADRKQIKLLELAIQHGEESKLEYDLIDYAIGTYRDVVVTQLLTVQEYADSANETVGEVKKRLEIAGLVREFLEYLHLPEQYHVAREYQVYSLFQEMLTPLKKLNKADQEQLKRIAYNNMIFQAVPDQRKFIRDIKVLINSDTYRQYFDDQARLSAEIEQRLADMQVHTKQDMECFAVQNCDLAQELKQSMELSLQRSRNRQLKDRSSENVNKCLELLLSVDPRQFGKMDDTERRALQNSLARLERLAGQFRVQLRER